MPDTRASLLSKIRDLDDENSWEEFDSVYRPLLVGYARQRGLNETEADDIAQQCMIAIAASINDFQRRVSFRGWLRGIIDNKVKDQLRKHRREELARTRDFEREQDTEDDPVLMWERQWNRTHLLYCLNQIRGEIAPVTYQAFYLYVIEEKPISDICKQLGMRANQVYVAKSRVLKRLKSRWDNLEDGLV